MVAYETMMVLYKGLLKSKSAKAADVKDGEVVRFDKEAENTN